jgi:tetratricopeptide (TPR) repeat protein
MARQAIVALALLLLVGCATRQAPVQVTVDPRPADELMQAGCYTCLRDAIEIYEKARSTPDVQQHLFETSLLLTLRAKELGLPFEPWLTRAKAMAATLPASLGATTALEVVEVAPEETSGLAPTAPVASRFVREVVPALASWRERVAATTLSSPIKQYLDLTLACADRATRIELESALPTPEAPFVRYKLAACNPSIARDAGQLLAEDPRWSEAAWFEGRRVLARSGDLTPAIALLTTAARAFPESGAMLMSLAAAQLAASQLESALGSYDAVIGLVPEHRGALLGRVLALTYLERHEDAIASATRIIELGTYQLSDAYYWRALNRYQLQAIEEAWADVTIALTLQMNTSVHTLAGLIAYARQELDTALMHFDRAWTLDSANCNAVFYRGLVQGDLNAWRDGASSFSSAMSCFVADAATTRDVLAKLMASDQSEAYKASKGAEHQKAIDKAERQAGLSAYNAAQGFARAGQLGPALTHLDVALTHDEMREKAEALKKLLGR